MVAGEDTRWGRLLRQPLPAFPLLRARHKARELTPSLLPQQGFALSQMPSVNCLVAFCPGLTRELRCEDAFVIWPSHSMSSSFGLLCVQLRAIARALLCTRGCAVRSWGWWHSHCFYPSPATSTRSCGLGNGLLFFFCLSFFTLKKVLIFKSLEHAWDVDIGERKLSLVRLLWPPPHLWVSAEDLDQLS